MYDVYLDMVGKFICWVEEGGKFDLYSLDNVLVGMWVFYILYVYVL